jgi:hypothetical protein
MSSPVETESAIRKVSDGEVHAVAQWLMVATRVQKNLALQAGGKSQAPQCFQVLALTGRGLNEVWSLGFGVWSFSPYSAFGYDPSTFTKLQCCVSWSIAFATRASVWWPSQSTKK